MRDLSNGPARWPRLAAAVALAAALAVAGCSRRSGADEGEGGEKGEAAVVDVTLTQVTRAPISRTVTISGTVAALPNRDVRVSSLVAGRVAELPVAEGDPVAAGQRVARIDDRLLREQSRQAEAALAQAEAGLENAKLARARNETLFERGIAARKEVEDSRTQEAVAEAALKQAQATASLAETQLMRAEIRSPIGGAVVKRFVSVGEQVDGTAAEPLFEVADRREVELYANVPAAYLPAFRSGQAVELEGDSLRGETLHGRVVAVSAAVDPTTDLGLVRIRLANEAGSLALGTFLSARIPLETHADALVAPSQAVYRDQEGRPHVYRVEGDAATASPVVLGIETPDRDEILSGVREGDSIVWTGGYGLGEKSRIRVAKP
ncbi:MAG: efflux RND transporter periplasmic adaptor subunit [Acidobacteriia bacterium]|nr:efflux RND transporter periplasmic adaptor subunit [Terriglobia bacterium]